MNSSTTPNLSTAMAVIAVIGAFLFAQHDDEKAQADAEDIAALHSRNGAARLVCGPDAEPEWLDDKTLQCLSVTGPTVMAARP